MSKTTFSSEELQRMFKDSARTLCVLDLVKERLPEDSQLHLFEVNLAEHRIRSNQEIYERAMQSEGTMDTQDFLVVTQNIGKVSKSLDFFLGNAPS